MLRENLLPYLADGEFLVLPASGHLIPLEATEALATAIASSSGGSGHRLRPPDLDPR